MPAARRKGNTIICSNRNCEKTLGIVKNGILEIKCRCGQFNDFVFDMPDPAVRITDRGVEIKGPVIQIDNEWFRVNKGIDRLVGDEYIHYDIATNKEAVKKT